MITDKGEIEKYIDIINASPRDFFLFDLGFKYDYLPHGMFIFESKREKLAWILGVRKEFFHRTHESLGNQNSHGLLMVNWLVFLKATSQKIL